MSWAAQILPLVSTIITRKKEKVNLRKLCDLEVYEQNRQVTKEGLRVWRGERVPAAGNWCKHGPWANVWLMNVNANVNVQNVYGSTCETRANWWTGLKLWCFWSECGFEPRSWHLCPWARYFCIIMEHYNRGHNRQLVYNNAELPITRLRVRTLLSYLTADFTMTSSRRNIVVLIDNYDLCNS